ncbi:MAG TPA: AraC family transcriptional regulator, partial [Candidatus Limnocylindria bacterium]|nr:AraC family transcriptional regulator [Candidatus Limnocylindria bacterium]
MSSPTTSEDLAFDELPVAGSSLDVQIARGANLGAAAAREPRPPHRHAYHELLWVRCGTGTHEIDGEAVDLRPGTLAVIGRGRVHRVLTATGFHGAAVRFGEELLLPASGGRTNPSWLIGTTATHSVDVPDGEISRLEGLLSTLADEQQRPPDARSLDLQRHFLSALLLWVGRWYEDGQQERQASDRAVLDLYRRFIDVLEQDFVRHHDAVHYADALAIPQSALSKALVQATGRTTKEHITERRLLEAARLLRFTELSVGEIAYRAGYTDQLYFSRAFRRRYGTAPTDYRRGP